MPTRSRTGHPQLQLETILVPCEQTTPINSFQKNMQLTCSGKIMISLAANNTIDDDIELMTSAPQKS